MTRTDTNLKDCFTIAPIIYEDLRGTFFEAYNKKKFEAVVGRAIEFVQDNHSVSQKGVLRGLHFQKGDDAQAKLVTVVSGKVLDVVVDLRPDSPTFKQHYKTLLSADDPKMIFIPRGMAHGFLVLEDDTVFRYKCDNYFAPESEGGIYYNDPDLKIDWGIAHDEIILSEKDQNLPRLKNLQL